MECLVRSNVTVRSQRRLNQDDRPLTTLFAGQMQFTLDLFKAMMESSPLDKGNSNLFFSPMSVYSALLLTYFGSGNQTEAQLARVLGFRDVDKVKADVLSCVSHNFRFLFVCYWNFLLILSAHKHYFITDRDSPSLQTSQVHPPADESAWPR